MWGHLQPETGWCLDRGRGTCGCGRSALSRSRDTGWMRHRCRSSVPGAAWPPPRCPARIPAAWRVCAGALIGWTYCCLKAGGTSGLGVINIWPKSGKSNFNDYLWLPRATLLLLHFFTYDSLLVVECKYYINL